MYCPHGNGFGHWEKEAMLNHLVPMPMVRSVPRGAQAVFPFLA